MIRNCRACSKAISTEGMLIDVWHVVVVTILAKLLLDHAGLRSMYQGACQKHNILLLQAYN